MGVSTRIAQQAPAAALSWTVYESMKRLLASFCICFEIQLAQYIWYVF
jgi:mitoferrin (mrs3/mrs4)